MDSTYNHGYNPVNSHKFIDENSRGYRPGSMIDGGRLRERMEALDISQAELARRVGVKQPSIFKILAGSVRSSAHLEAIARELKTSAAYLTGRTDDPEAGAYIPPTAGEIAEQLGLVQVEEIDLALGMGATYLEAHDGHVEKAMQWLPASWVRQFTDAPASFLTVVRPVGDSMYPTINDRDLVLIDRSQRRVDRQDAIWAMSFGGLGTIKRVRAMPDGTFKLMADNPHVREEVAVDGELFIMGRVAGVFRRI